MENEEYRTKSMNMRDRVLYSRGFLRLAGKTQVYGTNFGDHTRNRMTHSLEVAQIARSIARGVNKSLKNTTDIIDEDLVEAIALAHDLGHTPFGHAGERQLHKILNYNNKRVKGILFDEKAFNSLEEENDVQLKTHFDINRGFKHNWQSVRMLKLLCHEYQGGDMLPISNFPDSSYMVNAVLKHSSRHYKNDTVGNLNYYEEYLDESFYSVQDEYKSKILNDLISNADEIAQRHHDIEDAIAFRFFSLTKATEVIFDLENENGLPSDFTSKKGFIMLDKQQKCVCDSDEFFMKKVSHIIVGYLVNKYTQTLINKLQNHEYKEIKDEYNKVMKHLESKIKDMVLTSQNVKRMDSRGEFIIRRLFEAYAMNPVQMPNSTLNAVFREYMRQCIKSTNDNVLKGNIQKHLNKENGVYLFEHAFECRLAFAACYELPEKEKIYLSFSDNWMVMSEQVEAEGVLVIYKNLFRICLMRVIADYIAGMTDSYAEKEYQKLYGVVHEIVQ